MTNDLVHKLRAWSGMISDFYNASMMEKAATRITELEAQVAEFKNHVVTLNVALNDAKLDLDDIRTAEADMRERAAKVCDALGGTALTPSYGRLVYAVDACAERIRGLPLSTDTPTEPPASEGV